jgi:cbb3-type cytochrome oxidase subunit 3
MSKFKGFLLLFLIVLAAVFAWENKQPAPPLKLFGFDLMVFPTFLLVYLCLLTGFLGGWVAHALKVKKKKRQAESAQAPVEHQTQETQEAQ